MVNEIHVIFFDHEVGDINAVLDSLKDSPSGISLMICSFDAGCELEFRQATGKVFSYLKSPAMNENDYRYSMRAIRSSLVEQSVSDSCLKFNLTCANPMLSFIAFSLSNVFDATMYARNKNGIIQIFELSKTVPDGQLSMNCRMALLEIGKNPAGTHFEEIEIPTKHNRMLGKKGKNVALQKLLELELVYREREKRSGSGRGPYRWMLTDMGIDYFGVKREELEKDRSKLMPTD